MRSQTTLVDGGSTVFVIPENVGGQVFKINMFTNSGNQGGAVVQIK
jgi:hypothetical protein